MSPARSRARAPSWWRWLLALAALFFAQGALAQDGASRRRAAQDAVQLPVGAELTVPPVPANYVTAQRGSLRIVYDPSIASQVERTLERAERDARAVAAQLGLAEVPPLEVRLVPDPDTMRRLAPPDAPPPAYAVGVAYPSLRLTLVSMSAPESWEAADVRKVLRHEVSHLLLAVATRDAFVPRWFSEGVAVDQAGEHSFDRFKSLAVASFTRGLVPLSQLDAAFSGSSDQVDVAYAQSADFVGYLIRSGGADRFALLVNHIRDGVPFADAFRQTYNKSLLTIEDEWRSDMNGRFLTAPLWAGTGLLWIVGAGLLVVATMRRRKKSRAMLARWEREEAAADALRMVVVTPGMASMGDELHHHHHRRTSDEDDLASHQHRHEGDASASTAAAHDGTAVATQDDSTPAAAAPTVLDDDGSRHTLN